MREIKFLGAFAFRFEDQSLDIPSKTAQLLLIYLLLNRNSRHRRDKLASLLWPDAEKSNAQAYLRQNLWQLGKIIGKEFFDADKTSIGISPGMEYLFDVDQLMLAAEATSIPDLEEALNYYEGELLPGFSEDWISAERTRLKLVFENGVRDLLARLEEGGRWREVLDWSERWIAHGEAPEPAYRSLMRAHSAMGDAASVAAVYQRCVQDLDRELGISPSKETQEFYAGLTGADWAQPRRSPYRGLFSFQERDAPFFFGRETFTAKLFEVVNRKPITAVCGPSGIGKSSVVFAGLIPRLKVEQETQIVAMRPGSKPFQALSLAIAPLLEDDRYTISHLTNELRNKRLTIKDLISKISGSNGNRGGIVLAIDQLEELFSLVSDEAIRTAFLDQVIEATQLDGEDGKLRVSVLCTIRADFLSQVLTHRPCADALQEAILSLGPMTREELARAIKYPAERSGARLEEGLLDRLLDEVSNQPGNLPLLEFCLSQLWERRLNGKLTHEAYDAIGGVKGAITRYAEEVFTELSDEEQARAHSIFIQLVNPGQQTGDTRRIARRNEFNDQDWELVQWLVEERLLVGNRDTTGEQTVELVHEALITEWRRLKGWMDADRNFRSWQERLRIVIGQWEANDREKGALLRGGPLAEAELWLEKRKEGLSADEQFFIEKSVVQEDRERRDRERTRQRIIGGLALGLITSLLLAALAGFSWFKSERDERAAVEAYSISLSANARQLLDGQDNVAGLALAVAANNIVDPPSEARRILREAAFSPGPRRLWMLEDLGFEGSVVTASTIAPDGRTALINAAADGTLALIDINTGEVIRTFEGHSAFAVEIAFLPDGTKAISASEDGTLILWNLETGEIIHRLDGGTGWLTAVAVSPDGSKAIASALAPGELSAEILNSPGVLVLWDLETGEEIKRFEGGHAQLVADVVFSPDGKWILSSSGLRKAASLLPANSNIVLWEVASGEILLDLKSLTPNPVGVAFHPEGKLALVGSMEGIVYEVELPTGELVATLGDHTDWISDLEYTTDGTKALVSSADGGLTLWDMGEYVALQQFHIETGETTDIDISEDGRYAISAFTEGGLILWDLFNALESYRFDAHSAAVSALEFTPNGKILVSASQDNLIRLWSTDSWTLVRTLRGHTAPIASIAIDLAGEQLISADLDGHLMLWDLESGEELRQFQSPQSGIAAVAFHPNGKTAYSGSSDLTIIEWDLDAGEPNRTILGSTFPIRDLAIEPSGNYVLVGEERVFRIIDIDTGEEVRRLYGQTGLMGFNQSIAIDANGTQLVVGHGVFGNAVSLFDFTTGENYARIETDSAVTDVVISPDARTAFYSEENGNVVQLDMATGNPLWGFEVDSNASPSALAINPQADIAAIGRASGEIIVIDYALTLSEDLHSWVKSNRYVRELSCKEKGLYHIEPGCEGENRDVELLGEDAFGLDYLGMPTRIPQQAQVGANRGEIPMGDFQVWYYDGVKGETISIFMNADIPTTGGLYETAFELGSMNSVLVLISPSGELLQVNTIYVPPGEPYTTNAAILDFVLPETGRYRIEAKTGGRLSGGGYELIIKSSLE